MKIAFRADSSYLIGTGHVHRCIEIAKNFKKKKIKSIFISSNFKGNLNNFIKKKFSLLKIVQPVNTLKIDTKLQILNDAKKTVFFIKKYKIDYLFVDNYQIDLSWEKIVSRHCKIILLSDSLDRKTLCDYIINYHLLFEDHKLRNYYLKNNCKRLIGPQYSIIKKFNKSSVYPDNKNRIVVYMGGVDNHDYTSKIINVLKKKNFCNYNILVIIGKKNLYKKKIQREIVNIKNFSYILGNKKNIYNYIYKCSLSISNGGTSMYENLAVGNNLIVLPQSQLQKKICSELHSAKLVSYFQKKSQINSSFILKRLKKTMKKEKAYELSNLYDGKGAERIVEFFMSLNLKMNCRLTLVQKKDKYFLFNLLNNYEVVKNSLSRKITNFQSHENWFKKYFKSNLNQIYLLKFGELKIGQIRLDKVSKKKFKITYAISNEFRGKQYGEKLIKLILRKMPKSYDLIASVRNTNFRSKKIFNKIGFKPIISLKNKSIINYSLKSEKF